MLTSVANGVLIDGKGLRSVTVCILHLSSKKGKNGRLPLLSEWPAVTPTTLKSSSLVI